MEYQGVLKGLKHQLDAPVIYSIDLTEANVGLNDHIGTTLKLEYLGNIQCIACGRKIKKTYNNGYCYPCFIGLAENDLCIVKPHECHFDKGTCRDEAFGTTHCMIPHYVYLAISSDVKVGLTRKNNELKRWVDQGAIKAIPIAELPTRKLAGELEYFLSQSMPDKTNWRKMLKGDTVDVDLFALRDEVHSRFPEEFAVYKVYFEEITEIEYPIVQHLEKISSINMDKEPVIEGRLMGVKGQYLILEQGVINLKKYAGYHVKLVIGA